MRAQKRLMRKVDIGDPEWSMVLLNYWDSDKRLGLHRNCKGCGKSYETGHATVCHFKTEGNLLFCRQCLPISEKEIAVAQERHDKKQQ